MFALCTIKFIVNLTVKMPKFQRYLKACKEVGSSTAPWLWHLSLLISFHLKASKCSTTGYWCKHSDFLLLQQPLKAAFDHISSSYRFIFITLLLLFPFLVKATIFSLKTKYSQNTPIEIKTLRNRFLLGKSFQIKIPLFKMPLLLGIYMEIHW